MAATFFRVAEWWYFKYALGVWMIFIKRRISQVSGIALIVHGPSIWSTKVPLSIILLLWYHKIIWEFFSNIPPYYWVCAKICQYWLLKNAKIISRILWRFIGKIWKVYFSGEGIFGWHNPKKCQNLKKKYYSIPKRLLGQTNNLYTYKGHIEHVGFT